MKSLLQNKFLLITFILVLALGGWFYFGGGNDVALPLPADSRIDQNAAIGAEVDDLLRTVRSIKLDAGFFSENTFRSLQSFELFITSSPVGRENPFRDYSRASSDRVTTTRILTETE